MAHDQDIYKNLFYANPFRYRGYYQDSETGFYYCGNRYYDPAIGRFINADSTNTLMNTPMAYTDKNLYAYCDNNPVMRVDNGGEFWDTVFDVVSLCFSVVDVIKNPDDPWAWVGLAADVVSLAVPFATGGGTVVKAMAKVDDIVDFSEDSRSGNRHSRLSSLRQPQSIWEIFLNYFAKAPQSAQKRHDLSIVALL